MTQKRIFVSHAPADAAAALSLCVTFERAGASCWIAPRDLAPGEDDTAAITAAIRQARGVIVLLSAAAYESPDIVRQIEQATMQFVPLFAIRLEGLEPPRALQYFLSNAQWIDAFATNNDEKSTRIASAVLAALPTELDHWHPTTMARH